MEETRFKPGDIIRGKEDAYKHLRREIVDVRPTGYGWKFPDLGEKTAIGHDNYFMTEDSDDPELIWWEKVMTEWQPIETAPKDGTFIILGGGEWGDDDTEPAERVMIARWLNDEWMVCVAEGGYSCFPIIGPTHWMPVPERRKGEKEKRRKVMNRSDEIYCIGLPEDHYNPTGEPIEGVFIHRPFSPNDIGSTITVPAIDTRNWWQKTMPLWLGGKNYIPSEKMRIIGIWS